MRVSGSTRLIATGGIALLLVTCGALSLGVLVTREPHGIDVPGPSLTRLNLMK